MSTWKEVVTAVSGVISENTTGSAGTLTTARTLSYSGDVTGTGDFNGSANLDFALSIGADAVKTNMIKDAQVTQDKLADDSVGADQLASASVVPVSFSGLADDGTAGQIVITGGDGTWSYRTDNMYDITAMADKDSALATADEIPYYDSANSVHRTMTLTDLATYQASGTNSGIGNSGGLLKLDIAGLSTVTTLNKNDEFMIIDNDDSNVTKRKGLGHLADMFASTGLTSTNAQISVNTTQNIDTITGQSSLSLASNTSVTGNLAITGDLTVSGSTITTTTETLEINDNLIQLNADTTTDVDSGIMVKRGGSSNYKAFFWDESEEAWSVGTSSDGTISNITGNNVLQVVETTSSFDSSSTAVGVGGFQFDTSSSKIYMRTA